jgi:hypothetical protein
MTLMTVEQGELVGEDRAQGETRGVQPSSRRRRPVDLEDGTPRSPARTAGVKFRAEEPVTARDA